MSPPPSQGFNWNAVQKICYAFQKFQNDDLLSWILTDGIEKSLIDDRLKLYGDWDSVARLHYARQLVTNFQHLKFFHDNSMRNWFCESQRLRNHSTIHPVTRDQNHLHFSHIIWSLGAWYTSNALFVLMSPFRLWRLCVL